jgi:hypothetical protein
VNWKANRHRALWVEIDKRISEIGLQIVEAWWPSQHKPLVDAVGQVVGQERRDRREALAKVEDRVSDIEKAREIERRTELPQGELLERIAVLERKVVELQSAVSLKAILNSTNPPSAIALRS